VTSAQRSSMSVCVHVGVSMWVGARAHSQQTLQPKLLRRWPAQAESETYQCGCIQLACSRNGETRCTMCHEPRCTHSYKPVHGGWCLSKAHGMECVELWWGWDPAHTISPMVTEVSAQGWARSEASTMRWLRLKWWQKSLPSTFCLG
jgi:hypothetical protein